MGQDLVWRPWRVGGKALAAYVRGSRPCKERKDGAPALWWCRRWRAGPLALEPFHMADSTGGLPRSNRLSTSISVLTTTGRDRRLSYASRDPEAPFRGVQLAANVAVVSSSLSSYPFLACPDCRVSLSPGADTETLRCDQCFRPFAVRNGVPILLPKSVSFSSKAADAHHQSAPGFLRSFLDRGAHVGRGHERLFSLCPRGHIVNVGGGPMRERFDYINLNIGPMPNVDIVGDAARLPVLSGSLDAVVCNAVLEHVPDPWAVVAEITGAYDRLDSC